MINLLRTFLRKVSALCVASVLYLGGNKSALITRLDAQEKTVNQSPQVLREDPYLAALPMGFMPFEEFEKEFALGNVSTEQLNPVTKHLSQVMHKSIPSGMELLLKVDEPLSCFFGDDDSLLLNAHVYVRVRLGVLREE